MRKYARSALIAYRKRHGLKQQALAEYFGVSQGTLSRWESGASEPTIQMQKRIRDLLYNDRHSDMTRLGKIISKSVNRSLTTGPDVVLLAHGFLLPFAPLVGKRTIDYLLDFEREAIREYTPAAKRGEIIGSITFALRPMPAIIGGGPDKLVAQSAEFILSDGKLFAETNHYPLTPEQWVLLGGRPTLQLIKLDDE